MEDYPDPMQPKFYMVAGHVIDMQAVKYIGFLKDGLRYSHRGSVVIVEWNNNDTPTVWPCKNPTEAIANMQPFPLVKTAEESVGFINNKE